MKNNNPKVYFICEVDGCGVEEESKTRAHADRKFGVNRCHNCFDIWHRAHVVQKRKDQNAEYQNAQEQQRLERKAKAEQFAAKLTEGSTTKEQRYSSARASENKARHDKIMAERELEAINKEFG